MDKADQTALKPANANPWYVLMTLYGEQTGEEVDWALHDRNRAAWNAWSCQAMSEDERAKAAASSEVEVAELSAWPEMREEVERQHEVEWLRRNGAESVWSGVPTVSATVEMSEVYIQFQLVMNHSVFGEKLRFVRSNFASEVHFADAVFLGYADFEGAVFNGGAWFGGVVFFGNALFMDSDFKRLAWFDSAKFTGRAWFSSAEFEEQVSFIGVLFGGQARFLSANFGDEAQFQEATFSNKSVFAYVDFFGSANFREANFGGFVTFEGSRFHNTRDDRPASFADCQFAKPTNFRAAVFHVRYPDFEGTVFHDKTGFTTHPDNWPKDPHPDPVQAKASCAVIRHNLGKQGQPEAEHFFYRREMAFGKEIGGFWERLPYRLYDWLSGYGYSIERPAMGLVWLCLLPGLAFFMREAKGVPLADVATLFRSLGLSFANMFSFLGLQKTFFETELRGMGEAFQTLAGVQTVMGFVLLFFLGLGLRNRFRLK